MVLGSLIVLVLVLPFASRIVEHNLEAFLFIAGSLAVTASAGWSWHLVERALREPLPIAGTVLVWGFLFQRYRGRLDRLVDDARRRLAFPLFVFVLVTLVGFLASLVSAIVAALLLVEVIARIRLSRQSEVRLAVVGCYAIGFGAALTPIGEPLSTIITAQLRTDFWFMARSFGVYIVPGVLGMAALAAGLCDLGGRRSRHAIIEPHGRYQALGRAARVYMFVAALLLLGTGIMPLATRTLAELPPAALFWVNMLSAVLDNATLAAAEFTPHLSPTQVEAMVLGLLVSGGMLIPGNIPNIIAAHRLGIRTREYARVALPLGMVLMIVYFAWWWAANA